MPLSPSPYFEKPAAGGREAIHEAGMVVDASSVNDTTVSLRSAVPVARAAADGVKWQSESLRRDMGRYTGMRIARFQNWLYEQNREWHFSDEALCVLWMLEFPDAKCDYAVHFEYIDGVRREYNRNGHRVDDRPMVPCVAYRRRKELYAV